MNTQLVETVIGVHDQRVVAPGGPEHAGHNRRHGRVADADQLAPGAGRVISGPRKLNTVGTPRSLRTGPRSAWRDGIAGRNRSPCRPR